MHVVLVLTVCSPGKEVDMGPPSLGLVKMSYNDRFNELLDRCKTIANNVYSKASMEAKDLVSKVTQDLNKLKINGDK